MRLPGVAELGVDPGEVDGHGRSEATLAALLRLALTVCCAALAVLALGCGRLGSSKDPVQLRITGDFGVRQVDEIDAVSASGDGTVLGVLKANAQVTQGPDGRLASINGVAAGAGQAWNAYLNGVRIEKRVDAERVEQGDRVWLDLHTESPAPAIPAVVGAFPTPFRDGYDGRRLPTRIECVDRRGADCTAVAKAFAQAGIVTGRGGLEGAISKESLRVLVGAFPLLKVSELARQLQLDPASSGVFAKFSADGKSLAVLDATGRPVRELGPGTGLVAVVRFEDSRPTWIVTGTDAAGVRAAAGALEEGALGGHFALAIAGDQAVDLPAP